MILSKIKSKLLLPAITIGILSACGMEPLTPNTNERDLASARALDYNDEDINGKLAPPKGLVHKSLFSKQLRDDDERFERLESAVQAQHDILQAHLPAIESLTAIETDIQELVGQLQTLVSEPSVSASPPQAIQQESLASKETEGEQPIDNSPLINSTPSFQPIAQAQPKPAPDVLSPEPITKADYSAPAPAPVTAGAAVNPDSVAPAAGGVDAIRVAQGPGKTRVVLDSNREIDYILEFDNQEKLILLTAKDTDVSAPLESAASRSNQILSITSAKDGKDSNLIFVLQGVSSVSSGVSLNPNNDTNKYRYYFDIFN